MKNPVRLVAAIVALAVILAIAVFIHLRRPAHGLSFFNGSTKEPRLELPNLFVAARPTRHPAWEDPVAILLSVGGLVLAGAILTVGRERDARLSAPTPESAEPNRRRDGLGAVRYLWRAERESRRGAAFGWASVLTPRPQRWQKSGKSSGRQSAG